MRRLIVGLILVCLVFTPIMVYANEGRIHQVLLNRSIDCTGSTITTVYKVQSGGYFGAWVKLTTPEPGYGTHTPSVDISCQMSYDDTAANFATPTGMSLIASDKTDTAPTVLTIAPTPMPYMRFLISGNAANTTGTTVTMYLFSQD